MQYSLTHFIVIPMLVLAIATPALAKPVQPATLAKCQTLKDRVERYTSQRRKGGTAIQMQRWKDQMRTAESQFKQLECQDHRRRLR